MREIHPISGACVWHGREMANDWRGAKALLTPGDKIAEPYLELMRLANFAGCGHGC
jgi:hypothetical protein